jgi:hypothetical protein
MKLPRFDTYTKAALVLVGLSVFIMIVLLLTNRGDVVSATLVLVAFASFLAGLFIISFRHKVQVDHDVAATLTVPYTTTLSRVIADLGVSGPAHFIPVPDDGTFPAPVMQFNPVSTIIPAQFNDDYSFLLGEDGPGVLTIPAGMPLLKMMERDHSLTIPKAAPELSEAIREVNQDLLEIADEVTVTSSVDNIVMTLKNYKLISACIAARNESPLTCLIAPCPVCSLAGMILTLGLGQRCAIHQILVDEKARTVKVYFIMEE